MHITILALGSHGDILPFAALGRGLVEAGHKFRIITFSSYAEIINQQGLEHFPILGDAQALVMKAGANMVQLIFQFSSLAKKYAEALSDPVLLDTDLIICQLPGALYGYDLAEKAGVPLFQAAVMPLMPTTAFPLPNFPHLPNPIYNKLTYKIGEQLVWQIFRKVINRWRKDVLKLPPQPFLGNLHNVGTKDIPVLNGFSPLAVPPPLDWGQNVHACGYWLLEDRQWTPPEKLVRFIEAGEPPIFIGFGSMPVSKPVQTIRKIINALKRTGHRGIISRGWGGLNLGTLPDNIFSLDYAPYEWLFPKMKMIIHHGGSGTTAHALRSGVPSAVISIVFDQHFWGQRTASLSAGPPPIRLKKLSEDNLVALIMAGTANQKYNEGAANTAEKIRHENGIRTAVGLIEEFFTA